VSNSRGLARLEEYAHARVHERERKCVCQLVIVEGEPTPDQAAIIAHNSTCNADHSGSGFSVVEAPPRPDDGEL